MKLMFSFLIGFILCSFLYLAGCFYSATFNISNWHDATRFIVSITCFAAMLLSILILSGLDERV